MQITAQEIAELLGGIVEGDGNAIVSHPSKIEEALEAAKQFAQDKL